MDHKIKAFTLIELVLVIVILGIVGAFGAAFFAPILNLYFFTPTQLRTEYTANRIMDAVIEGDASAKGLRMTSIEATGPITSASDTSITYNDVNGKTITLNWSTNKITRSINLGAAANLPPEAPNNDINIDGITSGIIFKYYTSAEALISPSNPVGAADRPKIGRIQMDWRAYTGTGNIKAAQGKYLIHSGVQIKQF